MVKIIIKELVMWAISVFASASFLSHFAELNKQGDVFAIVVLATIPLLIYQIYVSCKRSKK